MIRNLLLALVFATLTVSSVLPASAQSSDPANGRQSIIIHNDSDYFGFDLETRQDVTLEQCKAGCLENLACKAFTYNVSARYCFLKSDFSELKPFAGAIAGRVVGAGSEPDLGAAKKLAFIQDRYDDEAERFRKKLLQSRASGTDLGFGALRSGARQDLAAGSAKSAADKYSAAAKIEPDDPGIWIELSTAARIHQESDTNERSLYRRIALSAALNSYRLSRTATVRAAALAQIAKALAVNRQYRNALSAYEQSLALNDDAGERAAFIDLRATHGFRVVNHTVDSESLNPRICVQFSEKLKKDSDGYENFVSRDNVAVEALDVSDKQICIDGVRHGQKVHIGLRRGLPSAVHEALNADVNLDIYVRDRSPAVRFTGSNFVLPYTARRGIPLVTVNTNEAKLELYRVGERALAQLLQGSQFLSQLETYEVGSLSDSFGQSVWTGSIDIKPELNQDVVTSIPVDEALPERKPGVYVLTARPASGNDYTIATQWFVISDIGLTTFSGSAGLRVSTRSLTTAKPLGGVDVTLIARNNDVLGTGTTDEQGQLVFDAGLTRGTGGGAATAISAKRGADDFVFLDIERPGFDFSDRGVTGRDMPTGVDVHAWTERGIYRAGETVHVAALARDPSANAITGLPLTFVFKRPDGAEDRRLVDAAENSLGGYALQLPLAQNAKHGTWQLQVFTDPKAGPVAETRFLVEDFLPERTDFAITVAGDRISAEQATPVKIEGRYLYGAPAAGLALSGEVVVSTKRERTGFAGYLFGLDSEESVSAQRFPIGSAGVLDAGGVGSFDIELDELAATTRPQTAKLVVRMQEESGRAVERSVSVDIAPQQVMIGVRPDFEDGQTGENSTPVFSIIAVDPSDKKIALGGVSWSLVKLERNYQWYRDGSYWQYEAIDTESRVAGGSIDISGALTTSISAPVQWGRYRLDIETDQAEGPATSVLFDAGWYVESASTETPDGLEIALDKARYKAGETARLKVSPRFAGEMLIAIGTDHVSRTLEVTVPAEGATFDIPVQKEWGAGAYVLATLYRPMDDGRSRMPARAIGVKWMSVDAEQRHLAVSVNAPAQTRPRGPLTLPVSITNLAAGQQAFVTVAAVDVGILNLTGYKAPDPHAHYFGQRRLGVAMRDIYGKLIDGSLGAAGRLRTGGDGVEGLTASGNAPTEKLVAFFSGIVSVDDNGKAEVSFDLPQFNGTVRIMATAWSGDGVGSAESDIIVRDPIVIAASLPKFMAPGDQSRLLVEVTNTDAPAGKYGIEISSGSTLTISQNDASQALELAAGQKANLEIPVTAAARGQGQAMIRLSGPDGISIEHEIAIAIRPDQLPITRKLEVALAANGGSLLVDSNLLDGNELNGAAINISVARPLSFDVASLMLRLDRYPYGCAEQTTSKALPLLYASEFPQVIPGLDEQTVRDRVQKAINQVLAYQSNSGGFSLWGTQPDDLWLSAYVTDFLTRAGEQGFEVPGEPMRLALTSLQNTLAYQNDLDNNDEAIAYALYVLARNRQASAGDLRYYADTQLQSFRSPIARAHLAAGMALYGDRQRAETAFGSAYALAAQNQRVKRAVYTYGSPLRDASAMLALASESRPEPSNTAAMARLVAALNEADSHTSTQEQAWMLLAARAEKRSNDAIRVAVNGLPHSGIWSQAIDGSGLAANPVTVTNRGDEVLRATVTTVAVPSQPQPAGGAGFTIDRTYYRMDGSPANVSEAAQNERFVVVINVKQLNELASRLIITDLLPAGFEIDNPSLVDSAKLANFSWLPGTEAAHSEFRDDRFVTAFDREEFGRKDFTVAYTVRAVTPGIYVHPAAQVEDMYRPQYSARTAAGWMQVVQR